MLKEQSEMQSLGFDSDYEFSQSLRGGGRASLIVLIESDLSANMKSKTGGKKRFVPELSYILRVLCMCFICVYTAHL